MAISKRVGSSKVKDGPIFLPEWVDTERTQRDFSAKNSLREGAESELNCSGVAQSIIVDEIKADK